MKTGSTGTAYCNFTLAVDKGDKGKGADFISCKAFGKSAENLVAYKKKGDLIALSGRITTGSYKAKDGHTVYTTDILADRIEFVGGRSESEQSERNTEQSTIEEYYGGFEAVEDEVPF